MTNSPKTIAKGELVFTSFLFVVSVVVLVDTAGIQQTEAVGFVGPEVFAYMVGGLLFVLSGLQILAVLRGDRGTPEGVEGGVAVGDAKWKSFGLLVAGLLAYTALLEILGFPIMGAVLFFMVAWALGARPRLRLGLIALVVSALIFVGFNEGLQLQLPSGLDTISRIQNPVTDDAPVQEEINDDGVVVENDETEGW
ncbi:MAG: tripartite tricarboxylate transporter TctB family protein [Aquiluna sp.]|nr:tripartite tricarboxylate transporter TctB family protein [Aquiluna sp.]MDP5025804.1 tripartite tricarboxylate transporter TctB family protein [Aquiluna sp.]